MRPGFRLRLPAPVVRIGATLAAFLLAIYGFGAAYHDSLGHAGSLVDNGFKALQLVVGQFPADLFGRSLPWSLHIARWALPLLTFWTTVTLAWEQIRNIVRLNWIARTGDHLILAGDEALAARVVAAERDAGRAVVLWVDDEAQPWVARAEAAGAAHAAIEGEGLGTAALGVGRARAALLIGSDDARNVGLAHALEEAARGARLAGDPLPIVARVDDLDLRRTLEARFARADRGAARVRLIALPDLAARRLFIEWPLDRFMRLDGDGERLVILIGFGAVAERYVLRMLAGAHFRDGGKPRFVVLAPDAEARERVFRARRPGADALAPVTFESAPIAQPALLAETLGPVIARYGDPVAIVIDADDDARALALAYATDGFFADRGVVSPPIHVRMNDAPAAQLGAAILPFGGIDAVADPEALLQDRHDTLARAIHDFYFEGRIDEGDAVGSRASMQEWEALPESVRDDNRLVADCYRLKLRDIGARIDDGAGGDAGFRLEGGEIEALARAEHDRWMAAKLIDGWVQGETRDDAGRRHPDIIPYDALSERIKELDREQVRLMTRLLPRSGVQPRRLLAIHVAEGSQGTRTIAELREVLAARHPDRLPVLIGRIDAAGPRAALIAARAAGMRVQPALAGNAEPLLAALDAADRDAVRALLRDADAVLAFVPGTVPAAIDAALVARAERTIAVDAGGRLAAAPWLG